MTPKIGIVTVLYNSEDVLKDFFNSLDIQDYKNFELYVVDNASPDNSLLLSKKLSENAKFPVRFIECKENYGVAKGNNLGIYKALENNCDYILLSNNDIELKPDTIFSLFEEMVREGASMAVPKIYYHGTNLIWAAGGKFIYHTGGVRHIGIREEDCGQYNQLTQIQYAPTCFMLINSSVFSKVGFMDERYFVYYDDTDFIYRAVINHHEKLLYIPDSIVWHKEGTSTGGRKSDFTLKYQSRNMVYFALKHYTLFHQFIIFIFNLSHLLLKASFTIPAHQRRLVLRSYLEGYRLYMQYKKDSVIIPNSINSSNFEKQ